ncbi:MAG TPA: FKBP-type peptidyl-prolyl cis-trans isomerase [Rhizomicrobium sp.]|jgi:FKBP-type peptidyl-prolyl cis-trans isomerase FklB|nr:FKBP-type peptidyl-prolyl cis-trans isomerase [Rhizomicrobium sp.]
MKFAVAYLALVLAGWTAAPVYAADDVLSIENNLKYLDENKAKKGVIVRPSGLQFRIFQNGYGKRPQSTDTVKVYYTGKLINGVIFDGTSPGLPASMKLNQVIPGWIEALQLMREGDHWQLVIPPNLGYGVRGSPDGGQAVPPNQTLIFDIKLLETTPAPKKGEKGYIPEPGDKDEQQ